jgi:hypothetical protein
MTDDDGFAAAYSGANESNLLNAWYERPAMVEPSCGSLFFALQAP